MKHLTQLIFYNNKKVLSGVVEITTDEVRQQRASAMVFIGGMSSDTTDRTSPRFVIAGISISGWRTACLP